MRIHLHSFTRVLCGFLLALGAMSLLGCGKQTGTVSGAVTYKGTPVTLGEVELYSKSTGVAGTGKLDPSGNFTIGVPLAVGPYEARVVPGWDSPDNPIPPPPKGKPTTTAVPKKAQEFNTSGLTVDVKSGSNTVTLELKD
jgi:hypothetical protein